MAKRAKYLGKCSFMAVRLVYPRGPNEERVRELMMLLLLLLPLKCLCHIRRNQSLQANRKKFTTKLQVELKQLKQDKENDVQ